MPLPKFISNIIGGKASDLIGSIGGVIDNLSQSKEEKDQAKLELTKAVNEHIQAMESEVTKQLEIQMKDMENSRNREIQIATSDKVPMLNKIVTPILALIIVCSTLAIWAMILFRRYEPKSSESMIIGALTTLSAGVISYYFGSSLSSNNKSKTIDNFINK